MKAYDPECNLAPKKPLPNSVKIFEPSVDKIPSEPSSEQKDPVSIPAVPAAAPEYQQPPQDAYQQDPYAEQPAF